MNQILTKEDRTNIAMKRCVLLSQIRGGAKFQISERSHVRYDENYLTNISICYDINTGLSVGDKVLINCVIEAPWSYEEDRPSYTFDPCRIVAFVTLKAKVKRAFFEDIFCVLSKTGPDDYFVPGNFFMVGSDKKRRIALVFAQSLELVESK